MWFDPDNANEEYAHLWTDMLEGKVFDIITTEIYMEPQGVAELVQLPNNLTDWFQVANSTPHISLMVAG